MEGQEGRRKLPDISDFRGTRKDSTSSRPGFRRNLIKYVQQYTDNTGIHGFKYVGERRRPILERVFWTLSFGACLYVCTVLIIDTWKKWDTTPVLVSFSKNPTSIWKVPFPAVTICPHSKSQQEIYNYTKALNQFMQGGNFTENEIKNFSASSLVCNSYLYSNGNKTIDLDAIDHIINIAPTIKSLFFQCRWDLHLDNCSESFSKILTEDGLCFTSNMLGKKELFKDNVYLHYDMPDNKGNNTWTLENGYTEYAKRDSFPRRAKYSGFTGSQVLVLKDFDENLDYSCKGPVQGFKLETVQNSRPAMLSCECCIENNCTNILDSLGLIHNSLYSYFIILHNPAEIPRASTNYLQASLDEELLIVITPEMMTTSMGIRDYEPHKRQCFFPNERQLSFFQVYTQQNCDFECLTNYTLSKCGCVAFYMPYEKSTPICGPGSIKCIFEAQSELMGETVNYENTETQTENTKSDTNGFACDCLPACSSLDYNAEFSQTRFNWKEVLIAHRENLSEFPGGHISRLTLFFKESQFIPAERNEIFGLADFLANCGGILGLFTGFSFLSLVEIVYFLSLRLICNVKTYGRHYWSGSSKYFE